MSANPNRIFISPRLVSPLLKSELVEHHNGLLQFSAKGETLLAALLQAPAVDDSKLPVHPSENKV